MSLRERIMAAITGRRKELEKVKADFEAYKTMVETTSGTKDKMINELTESLTKEKERREEAWDVVRVAETRATQAEEDLITIAKGLNVSVEEIPEESDEEESSPDEKMPEVEEVVPPVIAAEEVPPVIAEEVIPVAEVEKEMLDVMGKEEV